MRSVTLCWEYQLIDMWLSVVFCVLKVEEDRAQWGLWGKLPKVGDDAELGAATVDSSQKDFPNICLGVGGWKQMCTRPIDAIVGFHGRLSFLRGGEFR